MMHLGGTAGPAGALTQPSVVAVAAEHGKSTVIKKFSAGLHSKKSVSDNVSDNALQPAGTRGILCRASAGTMQRL